MKVNKTILTSAISAGLFMCSVVPAFAGGTFFVNSVTGNDANNCTSASTPCLTIAAARALLVAQAKPQDSTLKLAGTFNEVISFSGSDVTKPLTLDGLRITATEPSAQPTIDGTGNDKAVSVVSINQVEIDHLNIVGSEKGIYVSGYAPTFVNHIDIHHNDISGLAGGLYGFVGIELVAAKNSAIRDNTVHDININVTDETGYYYNKAIYLYSVINGKVTGNTINNISYSNTLAAVAGTHSLNVYGVYGSDLRKIEISDNTISNITASEQSTVNATNQYGSALGVYIQTAAGMRVTNNTVSTIASTAAASNADDSVSMITYGMMFSDLRTGLGLNRVTNNKLQTITTDASAVSGSATTYGLKIDSGFGVNVNDNKLNTITATAGGSLANAYYTIGTYAISASQGNQLNINGNRLLNITTNSNYTGATSGASTSLNGITLSGPSGEVRRNVIDGLHWNITTNDMPDCSNYGYTYAINLANSEHVEVTGNTVNDVDNSYVNASAGCYGGFSTYLINASLVDEIMISNNQLRNINLEAIVNDASDTSTAYQYLYNVYLRGNQATVKGNDISRETVVVDGGNANNVNLYLYGVVLAGTNGSVTGNTLSQLDATLTVSTNGYPYIYGISTSGLGETVIERNTLNEITLNSSGGGSSQYMYGINVTAGNPVYINANSIRNFNSGTTGLHSYIYGIQLNGDISNGRVFNNLIVGKDNTSDSHIGIQSVSDSTTNLDIMHNTVMNWTYPLWLKGGNQLNVLNNILVAMGDDGYALAWAGNTVNDNLHSDYNLFYNALGKTKALYNTDTSTAIHFGDWANKNGSFGYDLHSRYGNPNIKATGRLKPASKAVNRGTQNWGYGADTLEYTMLSKDINKDQRPNKGQVDIGADEL